MYKDSATITRMSIRGRMHETSYEGPVRATEGPDRAPFEGIVLCGANERHALTSKNQYSFWFTTLSLST